MRTVYRWGWMIGAVLLLAASSAGAQDKPKAKKKAPKPAAAEVVATAEGEAAAAEGEPQETAAAAPETPAAIPESTVDLCLDKTDNDLDGFIDCADQDCQIFAVCVRPVAVEEPVQGPVQPVPPPMPIPAEERGRMCADGIDNDRDGLVDCFESSCHATRHCRREIYYRPRDPKKAPGLIVSMDFGVAVPNFRGNDSMSSASENLYADVPFKQDVGGTLGLSVGVLPLRWLGVGMNLRLFGTGATNRYSDWDEDQDITDPKYEAWKAGGHVGGFVRFQLPFERFVPYLNIAGGYTYAVQHWDIYSPNESWDNIDMDDETELNGRSEDDVERFRHFTLALEPGFDVFVRDRLFAVGLRAWMPVWANKDPDVDNVGVMLSFTFTPTWREPLAMKPEYANPASTLEEETSKVAPAEKSPN